MVSVERTAFSV